MQTLELVTIEMKARETKIIKRHISACNYKAIFGTKKLIVSWKYLTQLLTRHFRANLSNFNKLKNKIKTGEFQF